MNTLFPVDAQNPPSIPGLSCLDEYISAKEERELAATIDTEPWDTSWERRRQLYGGAYGPTSAPTPDIPYWGLALAERMWRDGISERPFDQMLINEYLPGQGIAPVTINGGAPRGDLLPARC